MEKLSEITSKEIEMQKLLAAYRIGHSLSNLLQDSFNIS